MRFKIGMLILGFMFKVGGLWSYLTNKVISYTYPKGKNK